MKIDKIITLANDQVRLQFLGMERSLRAVGCTLPVLVIPYDDNLFDLPMNSSWWKDIDFCAWIDSVGSKPVMRKYQVLLANRYLFVDSDIVFLQNPEEALGSVEGFITSCCHWHNPGHAITQQVVDLLVKKTTTWQKNVFNSGQFACGQQLYTFEKLKQIAHSDWACDTVLKHLFHEQPGMNLLVNASNVEIVNLTMPPHLMESTWAGDYGEDFERYWADDARKPWLIHWAGRKMNGRLAIDELFLQYLNEDERSAYIADQNLSLIHSNRNSLVRTVLRAIKSLLKEMYSQDGISAQ
jgi:hypothetical protein